MREIIPIKDIAYAIESVLASVPFDDTGLVEFEYRSVPHDSRWNAHVRSVSLMGYHWTVPNPLNSYDPRCDQPRVITRYGTKITINFIDGFKASCINTREAVQNLLYKIEKGFRKVDEYKQPRPHQKPKASGCWSDDLFVCTIADDLRHNRKLADSQAVFLAESFGKEYITELIRISDKKKISPKAAVQRLRNAPEAAYGVAAQLSNKESRKQ